MKLIFDILRFLFIKGFKFIVILGLLYGGFVVKERIINWQQQKQVNLTSQESLKRALTSLSKAQQAFEASLIQKKNELSKFIGIQKRLKRSLITYDELEPNFVLHPIDHQQWELKREAAQQALDKAIQTEKILRTALSKITKQLQQTKQSLLRQAGALKNLAIQYKELTWFEAHLKRISWTIYLTAAFLLFAPMLNKLFWYFGPGRWIEKQKPYQIELNESADDSLQVSISDQKQIELLLSEGDEIVIKEGYYSNFSEVLEKQNRWIWKGSAWLISYAAQLVEMTHFKAPPEDSGKISLISRHPDFYLVKLSLKNCPGIVLKPQHIIAISGDIDLRTKWQFFSIHNWMRLVFRHIIFCGSGNIYVALHGGSHSTDHASQAHRLKEEHLVAYESSAKLALVRNENLWHYICGKSNLFDYKFTNQAFKLLQNQSHSPALEDGKSKRFIDIILSSLGKILGF